MSEYRIIKKYRYATRYHKVKEGCLIVDDKTKLISYFIIQKKIRLFFLIPFWYSLQEDVTLFAAQEYIENLKKEKQNKKQIKKTFIENLYNF